MQSLSPNHGALHILDQDVSFPIWHRVVKAVAVESPACILCRQLRRDDKRGLCVRGNYICPACEARIISLTRNDPDYDIYISGLKKIWSGSSA